MSFKAISKNHRCSWYALPILVTWWKKLEFSSCYQRVFTICNASYTGTVCMAYMWYLVRIMPVVCVLYSCGDVQYVDVSWPLPFTCWCEFKSKIACTFGPHHLHSMHRCGLLLQMSLHSFCLHLSLCLSLCWSWLWILQKGSTERCRLGTDLLGHPLATMY